jgi:putative transposase
LDVVNATEEVEMTTDPAEQTALDRYRVIAEAASERLTPAERGLLVRELAGRTHESSDGSRRDYSRATLDRWIRAYRAEGLDGLRPQPRSDVGMVRRVPELLQEACALRRELPARSAAQISRILQARHQVRVSPRTLRGHLLRLGLGRAQLSGQRQVYGRFEAERPNEIWVGDVLVGPFVPHPRREGSRRAYLFLFVDDYSRLLLHGRWMTHENTRAGQDVLRQAILRRGLPETAYLDNGSPFANAALDRTCAVLGIRLVHSRPYSPQGRGKQERLNRFIREGFVAEAEHAGIESFSQLNDRFAAWSEQDCNTRVHAETGQTPISRFLSRGLLRQVDLELLHDAFRWSVMRMVTRTAQVSIMGNRYSVDPALCGRRVELRYDPEDLARIEVWHDRRPFGNAVPFLLGRHVHRQVPQAEPPPPPQPTGIDYLGLVEQAHQAETLGQISYRDLPTTHEEDQIS